MQALKRSRQREAIKAFLMTSREHPTADMVYQNIRQEFPNISLGTVYRNLALLVDIGEAIRVPSMDNCDHFDGRTEPHYHFVCSVCGTVMDLELEDCGMSSMVMNLAQKEFSGVIQSCRMHFCGVCEKCCKKNEKIG